MRSAYAGRGTVVRDVRRIVIALDPAELAAVDEWAVGAGQPHRTAALRHLIERGLAVEAKTAKRREHAA